MATSGFIHLLKAEHAGTVYSSSQMKIKLCFHAPLPKRNCPHKWSSPATYRHYLRWAAETWITADKEMHIKTKKGLYIPTAYVVCWSQGKLQVVLYSCIFERWPATTRMVWCWEKNVFNTVMSFHPLPVATVAQHSNKTGISNFEKWWLFFFFFSYNLQKLHKKWKRHKPSIRSVSVSAPLIPYYMSLSASYSLFISFPKRPIVIIIPIHLS